MHSPVHFERAVDHLGVRVWDPKLARGTEASLLVFSNQEDELDAVQIRNALVSALRLNRLLLWHGGNLLLLTTLPETLYIFQEPFFG